MITARNIEIRTYSEEEEVAVQVLKENKARLTRRTKTDHFLAMVAFQSPVDERTFQQLQLSCIELKEESLLIKEVNRKYSRTCNDDISHKIYGKN